MHFKIAWRNLTKDRQFTLLNVLGLATGLASALLIYLWVNDELHVDKFNKKDSQLYQVMSSFQSPDGVQTSEYTPGLLATSLGAELPEVEYAVPVTPGYRSGVISSGDKHIKAMPQYVGTDFFNVFSYDIVAGDERNVLTNKYSIILSEDMAARLFNTKTNVVGKVVQWDEDTTEYIVSGVFKKPLNTSERFDVLFSYQLHFDRDEANMKSWQNGDPFTYVILKKGTDVALFNKKIANFIKTKDDKARADLVVRKYSDKYLYNTVGNGVQIGGRIEYVRLFTMVAFFILIIACINFMNLSTAKAVRRFKEVGIKKVAGASRANLIIQFLSESILLTFISLAVALILVIIALPEFNAITEKHLTLNFNTSVILTILAITFLTALIAGSYPAFYLSGFTAATVLKGKLNTSLAQLIARKGLVVFQFVLSVVFIVSVLTVYKQMQLIQTINLGYNKNNVVTFKNEGELNKRLQSFLSEIKNIPGVIGASTFEDDLIGHHGGTENVKWQGKMKGTKIEFAALGVNYGLAEMLGFTMVEGRSFSRTFGPDDDKIIFNQSAIAAMGLKNPIGKTISVWGGQYQIIGVVKDFHFESLYEKVKPCFMRCHEGGDNVLVKISGGSEKEAISSIGKLYKTYNPGLAFEYKFLDDDYQAMYVSEWRVAVLSRWFATLAIIISCLGLFGLAAFTAQKRQKEIGIRKVVGATVTNVVVMLSEDFLKLVLVAILIAFPLAWWAMHTWLQSFAYRVNIGTGVFLTTGCTIVFITLFTISFQAVKAAVANPVMSLRNE